MGYSADEQSRSADIIITDVEATWAALVACQDNNNGQLPGATFEEKMANIGGKCLPGTGHISWCDRMEAYTGTTAERVAKVLQNYGFEGSEAEGDNVTVGWWGGDKIGSCWDDVTDCIAKGLKLDGEPITLIMCGEDTEMWATILVPPTDGEPGHAEQRGVTITVND